MAFLDIKSGDQPERRVQIDKDGVSIGRAPDNTITVIDAAASGHHCRIDRVGNRYTLRDAGSTNGTRLNGAIVQDSPLKPGDVIQVGSVELRFDGPDVEVPPTRPEPAAPRTDTIVMAQSGPSTAFVARRNNRALWTAVAAVVIVVALAGLAYWFLAGLFRS